MGKGMIKKIVTTACLLQFTTSNQIPQILQISTIIVIIYSNMHYLLLDAPFATNST